MNRKWFGIRFFALGSGESLRDFLLANALMETRGTRSPGKGYEQTFPNLTQVAQDGLSSGHRIFLLCILYSHLDYKLSWK